jgi:hypothetical protein
MTVANCISKIKDFLRNLASQRYLRHYQKRFLGDCFGCFNGVYLTFGEASVNLPKSSNIGYDNKATVQLYAQGFNPRSCNIQSFDYPVLFWFSQILRLFGHGLSVFDLGGGVGLHYFAYSQKLKELQYVDWTVCEVDAMAAAGLEISSMNNSPVRFLLI